MSLQKNPGVTLPASSDPLGFIRHVIALLFRWSRDPYRNYGFRTALWIGSHFYRFTYEILKTNLLLGNPSKTLITDQRIELTIKTAVVYSFLRFLTLHQLIKITFHCFCFNVSELFFFYNIWSSGLLNESHSKVFRTLTLVGVDKNTPFPDMDVVRGD